jgi:hypothetical protein
MYHCASTVIVSLLTPQELDLLPFACNLAREFRTEQVLDSAHCRFSAAQTGAPARGFTASAFSHAKAALRAHIANLGGDRTE